jgi:type VI secretion system protein ImpL
LDLITRNILEMGDMDSVGKKLSWWQKLAVLLAFLIFSVLIWVYGPILSFGEMHPFEGIDTRMISIAILAALCLVFVFSNKKTTYLWTILSIVLCVLIWYASPALAIDKFRPFESESVRLLMVSLIIMSLVFYWMLDYLVRKYIEERSSAKQDPKKQKEHKQPKILPEYRREMKQVLAQIASLRGGRRLFRHLSHADRLPLFVLYAPHIQKSDLTASLKFKTVLNASGLNFPESWVGHEQWAQWNFGNDHVFLQTGEFKKLLGFSSALKSKRPRAPINGLVVHLELKSLLDMHRFDEAAESKKHHAGEVEASASVIESVVEESITSSANLDPALAGRHDQPISQGLKSFIGQLRRDISELRRTLRIRFPVYVVVNGLEEIQGFGEYFQHLTADARAQIFGFSLPYHKETLLEHETLKACLDREFSTLTSRLYHGLTLRLHEEYDIERRHKLYGFPRHLEVCQGLISQVVHDLFFESTYDETQKGSTLRGVYFTSTRQKDVDMATHLIASHRDHVSFIDRPFFIHDLFKTLVSQEAHLVCTNLQWEARFRILRGFGHITALSSAAWLLTGMTVSYEHNHNYLKHVEKNTTKLAAHLKQVKEEQLPELLESARTLAMYSELDVHQGDDWSYRYGLYQVDTIRELAQESYQTIQDKLLVPHVVRRIEKVLQEAIQLKDERLAYDTLRVYLMLHDAQYFKANDIKTWIRKDWERASDQSLMFGGRSSMVEHVLSLFDDRRAVQSPFIKNDALINQARVLLGQQALAQRIYERMKEELEPESPAAFSLASALGPQAGIVFARNSGAPLDQGVPGLFTYAGYHSVFKPKLKQFVESARHDDAWVMGHQKKNSIESSSRNTSLSDRYEDPYAQEIRRMYLEEYANLWEKFLADLTIVRGEGLAFNLQVLRTLAAPDSPLVRLGRYLVQETTISREILMRERNLAERTVDNLDRQAKSAGIPLHGRLEKNFVDSRFGALREVVLGYADPDDASNVNASVQKGSKIDVIIALINEYYTLLVIADNALNNQSMPAVGDSGSKIRLEASKLPSPFRQILQGMTIEGARKINQGIGDILISQTEQQVGRVCRRIIDGKYPFSSSDQEVNPEDFAYLFAEGGLLDAYFQKNLAPYVDTTTQVWHYKVESPDLPPVPGPNLDAFQKAAAIRNIFFRDSGGKKMSWKMDMKVVDMDPEITQIVFDVDGQTFRHYHGPVVPFKVSWPGPRGGAGVEFSASPRVSPISSSLSMSGPWSLFKILERGKLINTSSSSQFAVQYQFDGRKVTLDVSSGGAINPIFSDVLQAFKCPGFSG